MANQKEIEAMYDWVDKFHMLSLGEYADFTGAYFNGDFSKTLRQAQRDKHQWILDGIKFKKNDKVLDIGSGWGPMLKAIQIAGGKGKGLTLSSAQKQYCKFHNLDVQIQDWKIANKKQLGKFDGIVSVGAFEHFCSIPEKKQGNQEQIYQDFFKLCADLLPKGGRLYLQTMTWGKRVPDPYKLSLRAPQRSPERILARLEKFYPGSWLPNDLNQIKKCAQPYFKYIKSSNGRLDYIEALNRWGKSRRNLWKSKNILKTLKGICSLIPRYLTDKDFRVQLESVRHKDQQVCFQKEIMSHERIFFEKK